MIRTAVLGASGYTGAELLRFLVHHPNFSIKTLTADRNAGQPVAKVHPHLARYDLPDFISTSEVEFQFIDLVFCALPHGTTQTTIGHAKAVNPQIKIVDLSADFRLENPKHYEQWYGGHHRHPELQVDAVYGLTEIYREDIARSWLVANPGCHTTASLLPLIPLLENKLIRTDNLIIDTKSGVSGAGRALKQNFLFSEVNEGFSAYGIGAHRHMAELDQELGKAAQRAVQVSFTPHLAPMQRGIYATIYVELSNGARAEDLTETLRARYEGERFVSILTGGEVPKVQNVTGSNEAHIAVFPDRYSNRAIILSAIDNLVKGASGQAIQNANLLYGLDEATAIGQAVSFP